MQSAGRLADRNERNESLYNPDILNAWWSAGYRHDACHADGKKREDRAFQEEAYYKVSLSDGKLTVTSENIQSEAEAEELRKLCDGTEAMVTKVKKAQKRVSPPKLYDLTSLQREANRYFGYTAQKTLDMLQELYEERWLPIREQTVSMYGRYERNGRNTCRWNDRFSPIFEI